MSGFQGVTRLPKQDPRVRRNANRLGTEALGLSFGPALAFRDGKLGVVLADGSLVTGPAGLSAALDADGGLTLLAGGVGVELADDSLKRSSAGLSAKLDPGGGIGLSSEGLLVVGGIPIAVEVPAGAVDGTNDTFFISEAPQQGQVLLFVDGLLMSEGTGEDYTRSSTEIVFESGSIPVSGDVLLAALLKGPGSFGEVPVGAVDGTNDTFTLANTPKETGLMFFMDGMLMTRGSGLDYTVAGDTITVEPDNVPTAGDRLFAVYEKKEA